MQLAEEYGVVDIIDFGPDFETREKEEGIEFLEKSVKMKKAQDFYQKQYKERKEIIRNLNVELESAESEVHIQEIIKTSAAKHDWIIVAEDGNQFEY